MAVIAVVECTGNESAVIRRKQGRKQSSGCKRAPNALEKYVRENTNICRKGWVTLNTYFISLSFFLKARVKTFISPPAMVTFIAFRTFFKSKFVMLFF